MTQYVNLYTPDMRPRRDLLTLNRFAALAVFAVIAVFAGASYASWHATAATSRQQAAETQAPAIRQAVELAQERLSARVVDPRLQADVDELSAVLRNRALLLKWVEQFAQQGAKGFSPYLAGLARQAVDGVWLTELEVDRETDNLALAGLTRDASLVPLYLERLRVEEAFAGRGFRHFELQRPEADSAILGFRVAVRGHKQELLK